MGTLTPVRLAVAIMAHPSRRAWVDELAALVKPDAIAWDQRSNIWDTCRRAWLAALETPADWYLVVQDDTLATADLRPRLEEFIGRHVREACVVNLFMGMRPRFKAQVESAIAARQPYFTMRNIHHELALCLPARLVRPMVDFVDRTNRKDGLSHDRTINRFVTANRLRVVFPMPSLVSHRAGPSLHTLNRGQYPRGARAWVGQ